MRLESDEMCPTLLLQFKEAYERAQDGEVIEVKTPWYAAVDALRELCNALGSEYLGWQKEDNKYVIKIKVRKEK
ncbi:MAG: sulfurtransferase TusA family protein [Thermoprotei archaeon]|jgi:TusA-related sulfurtransferase